MNRKKFLGLFDLGAFSLGAEGGGGGAETPEQLLFKDDGSIPNSRFPPPPLSERLLRPQRLHYHSTSHEVLGIYSGSALVHLGGE